MLKDPIGVGSHWLKRSRKSLKISRTRPATSGASSSRLSRARGSSALCMTPRLPVHSKKRVRVSISFSGLNVSWSSSPGHAVVGVLMRWSRSHNISFAMTLNEGSDELWIGDILKTQSGLTGFDSMCCFHAEYRLMAAPKWSSQQEQDVHIIAKRVQTS